MLAMCTQLIRLQSELVMAKSAGLQLFPILFRGTTFESMPDGLQYMLVNCCVGRFLIFSIVSRVCAHGLCFWYDYSGCDQLHPIS